MTRCTILCALLSLLCTTVLGAEPQPLMTTSGKVLVSEDFGDEAFPSTFRGLKTPDAFEVEDGALRIVSRAGQSNSTHGAFTTKAHNLTVAFRMKFVTPGILYIGIDGYKEAYKGNTHLVRFSIAPDRMAWDQKRGGPDSKHAIADENRANRAAKREIRTPTAEQLDDPTYFRTEALTSRPVECAVEEWHDVLIEVNGDDLVAQVDGDTLVAISTEVDSMKSRIGIGLTGRSTTLVDNVRVWENTRRDDWQKTKATLTAQARATAAD